ncbi:MAG TPA: hypothetical protein VLK65_27845 [Vicinamibacteria bacterium]|nr:hypothetical protein [Vicinamibacteria bacterium]
MSRALPSLAVPLKAIAILTTVLATALAACHSDPTGPSESDCSACLEPQILDVLTTHIHDLEASANLLTGHPSEREMVCFFSAPGLTGDYGVPAAFIFPVEVCSKPVQFDPYCEDNRCSRLSCTGEGAGWVVSYYLEQPASYSTFQFASARLDCAWRESAPGISFTVQTLATDAQGRRWDMAGSGTMDPNALDATETFPALCPRGALALRVRSSPSGGEATLSLGGVPIAVLDASEKLVPTGSCR